MNTRDSQILFFDSLTDLVSFCQRRYDLNGVSIHSGRGELNVVIEVPEIGSVSLYVMHLEGGRIYVVNLPDKNELEEIARASKPSHGSGKDSF